MRITSRLIQPARQPARQLGGMALVALLLAGFACGSLAQAASKDEPMDQVFLAWARQNLQPITSVGPDASLSDLEPLRGMIGGAQVVSFGEGLHGGAEPLEFRNLLFRFLVEKMGFTAMGIESGIIEGFGVNEYVLGGSGDLASTVAQGFTFGFNRYPQEATLVEWMRGYNSDAEHARDIQFYGFDVPPDDPKIALEGALKYLDGVDPAAATELHSRVDAMLPMLNLNRFKDEPNQYAQLTQAQRDQLTAAIVDLITLFKIHQASYTAATSILDYDFAFQSAVVALQVDEYLRQVPVGWTPQAGMEAIKGTITVSDRSKADNAYWMKEQQGPGGKLLLFAHRDHIATALTSIRIQEGNPFGLPPAVMPLPPMMGTFLQSRYGTNLVTIGNLLAEDNSKCQQNRAPAPGSSLEGLLATLDTPFFLLDLRTAPPDLADWLQQPRELYGIDLPDTLSVGQAFDIIFFSRQVMPAAQCR